MHFTGAFVLAIAGIAAAQSSSAAAGASSAAAAAAPSGSSSSSGCGSSTDGIIASCLNTEQTQLKKCSANDWRCMCHWQKLVVICYNDCPTDPAAVTAKQSEQSWCEAAKQQPGSSSTAPKATGKVTTSAAAGTSSSTTAKGNGVHTGFAKGSGSASGSAAASSSTGAAGHIAPAGGLVAAVFGLALL